MANSKKIQVINGEGNELDISPVYDHLPIEKPNMKKKENIIVPEEKKIDSVKKESKK